MSSTIQKKEEYFDEAIRLFVEEKMTPNAISKILPIAGSTIQRWIVKFASENAIDRSRKSIMSKTKELSDQQDAMAAMAAELRQLKKEKTRLESELRMSKIKADLYDEMINVAEKQFNIKIRKKAGAK